MQTPQGHEIIAGRVVPTDWLRVIFNPSFPFRLAHMGMAAYLATALMVGAAGAWHLLRGRNDPAIRTMTSMAMWMLLIAAPIQAMIGDSHGLNTLEHQPIKIAAIEGHWKSVPNAGVPLTLFGISVWPNVVPPAMSIWDAAGPPQSLGFTLVGALLVIPMILGYTAWGYYVFRGKVDASRGYH
jgi:cytochrome d ubiquinol oxidase subunit I